MYSSIEEHRAAHSAEAISNRLRSGLPTRYLKDFIYSSTDGAVTTFAIIAGISGAQLSHSIILVLGFVNVFADGFSMAVSNFLGSRSEIQQQEAMRQEEIDHIGIYSEGEIEEIRQIFYNKGFRGAKLETLVETICRNTDKRVDTMLAGEHGIATHHKRPAKAAWTTFLAFFTLGAIPLAPFIWAGILRTNNPNTFYMSCVMAGFAFFLIGTIKSRFVRQNWFASGLETLSVGGGGSLNSLRRWPCT